MRRRRKRDAELSLDSFLDIITNVVGVMVLVAVITVINSRSIKISLGTPVLRDPPEGAERVLFECKGNRVVRINEEKLDEILQRNIDDYKQREGSDPDLDDLVKICEDNYVGDSFYRLKIRVQNVGPFTSVARILESCEPIQGESPKQLRQENSDYQKIVKSLDPKKNFLYFIVREDGFEVFRASRKLARTRGLSVGWLPFQKEKELAFSSHGISTRPQE